MQAPSPLLYSPYVQVHNRKPVLTINLLPLRKLVTLSGIRKEEFRIPQYLKLYGIVFLGVGLAVCAGLAIIQLL